MKKKLHTHFILHISIILLLVFSLLQIFPEEVTIVEEVSATTTWHQTNWSNLYNFTSKEHIEIINRTEELCLFSGHGIIVADTANHRIVMANMKGEIWYTLGLGTTSTTHWIKSCINNE